MLLTGGSVSGIARNPGVIERKTYMWKVYDPQGNFLEVLNDVIDEPNFSYELNSIGSSMTIILARNSDSIVQNLEPLLDSDENPILDSNNQTISTTVQSRNKVGAGSNITLNNRVDLYVFYGQTYPTLVGAPNGRRIFSGFISEINLKYGDTENTEVQLMSYGYDLDHQIVTTEAGLTTVAFNSYDPGYMIRDGITWANAGGLDVYTDFSTLEILQGCNSTSGWAVSEGTPTLSLETTNFKYGTGALKTTMATQSLRTNIKRENITAFAINDYIALWVYIPVPISGAFSRIVFYIGSDATFVTNYRAYAIYDQYNGEPLQTGAWNFIKFHNTATHIDIGTPVLSSIECMQVSFYGSDTTFRIDGALVDYITQEPEEVSVYPTDTIASYTFRLNTYKELLEKAVQLAPYGYSYYVGLGDNLIHFFPKPTEVAHKFILGKHIKSLNLRSYIGDVVNDVTYTGGGDPALFRRKTITPIAGTRRGLSRLSDSRVTLTSSADILIQGEIDDNKNIQYRSTIDILDKTYDIESIKLGDLVGFSNFNTFVDSVTMQIVAINYTPSVITLQLDTVPRSVPKRLEEIRKALSTTDNTNTPDQPIVI